MTGTSVAAPIVATLFAASGHSAIGSEDVIGLRTTFNDVTSGANGPCGSELCVTGIGWDGPTGWGSPNAAQLGQGAHTVEVEWLDTAGAHQHAAMMVTVADPTSASMSSGCSAGGGAGCAAAMLVPVLRRRRRRA